MRQPIAKLGRILAVAGLALTAVLATGHPAQAATLSPVPDFGSNPGNLSMFAYLPDDLPPGAPLVVALHGCTQDAATYHAHSGWRELADKAGFGLVYPQQETGNNANKCFNWFEPGDQERGQGEAASIKQMIDHAVAEYGIDAAGVYVTGLSAGGAMSAIMLATYSDALAGGSIIGGIPYKCAVSVIAAYSCMNPGSDKTPQQWGELARGGHPGHDGARPLVAIWHGTADYTVVVKNADESRDQWTDVAAVPAIPTETVQLPAGTTLEKYGDDQVRRYSVADMGHGTPVDPGTGPQQCGTAGAHFLDTICSSYHDAVYFGLMD